jgi:hypothetical protein
MRMYSAVHTGAKSQLGGLKLGLFRVANHVFTEICVAALARKPMIRQIKTQIAI